MVKVWYSQFGKAEKRNGVSGARMTVEVTKLRICPSMVL